jgi:hypothetical protein
MFLTSK